MPMIQTALLEALLVLSLLILVLTIFILRRGSGSDSGIVAERLSNYEKNLKDEFARNRKETSEATAATRRENTENLMKFQESLTNLFSADT